MGALVIKGLSKVHAEGTGTAKTTLKNKKKMRGITLPDFKAHYEIRIIKTVMYWQKGSYIVWWKRITSPETVAHKNTSLTKVQKQLSEGRTVFSVSSAGTAGSL